MKRRWRILSLILAAAMVLSSCGGGGGESNGGQQTTAGNESVATPEASSKDTLVIANTSGEPGNLHPYNMVSVGAVLVQSMIFDALISLDTSGEPQPALAESWEVTEDQITFHLREGVTFQNGDPLTTDDVIFSIQEMALNSTGGKATNYSACDVENITAPDDQTIVIPMTEPNATQLGYFADLYIVNKAAYQEMGDQYQYEPIGTGPFQLTDWVVGDRITLERYDEYWEGAALLKTVQVRTISEVSQALIEVETGGADVMISPDGADVERVLNGEIQGVKAITEPTLVLRNNNVNFNHNSQYMGNKKVREAIAHCIDRESWTSIISPGIGVPAYSCLPSGVWGYDESLEANYPYTYDLEAAKQCLAEAGYPDGFTAILYTDNRSYHQSLVELLRSSLSEIGITLDVQTMELNKQKELMSTGEGYDLFILDNVGNPADPLSCVWRDVNPMFSGEEEVIICSIRWKKKAPRNMRIA